jgi:hypothetical protein
LWFEGRPPPRTRVRSFMVTMPIVVFMVVVSFRMSR